MLEEFELRSMLLNRLKVRSYLCRRGFFIISLALLVAAGAPAARAEKGTSARNSRWWSQVEPIEGSLNNGRWKYARRNTGKLTKTILEESWNDRELDEILAELALYRAIAEVNLGQRDTATWYWFTALNLSRRVGDRDLTPYGALAASLGEIPFRKRGVVPASFQGDAPRSDGPVTPPGFPSVTVPTLLNNSAAARQRSADFEVEVIVDEAGALHQPVVVSRHLNPVVVFACLDWLHGAPALEPARHEGRAVPATYTVVIEFRISPYPGGLVITEEPD